MSACSNAEHTVDVYGIRSHKQAERLLVDLVSIGFVPAVMFSVDWRCRTIVAADTRGALRLIYAKVGGPKAGVAQWSVDPRVFSSGLKRAASRALGKHLSGSLKAPLRLRYTARAAEK